MSKKFISPPQGDWTSVEVQQWVEQLNYKIGQVTNATAVDDSTAATVADLKSDFNELLASLRAAGILNS